MPQANQWGLQNSYGRAKAAVYNSFIQSGYTPSAAADATANAVLAQSYLRLEQPLLTTQNQLNFPVLVNAANANTPVRATEKRLNQQDSFFCSSIGIYLALAASATDTAFRLETFPNVNIFPNGAAGNETVMPLNNFYNGDMSLVINKSVIVPNYPLSNFLKVPFAQRLTTTAANTSNEFDPGIVALLEPNWNLVGTKDNRILLNLPAQMTAVDANTYVVIILHGTLAQNVTLMS